VKQTSKSSGCFPLLLPQFAKFIPYLAQRRCDRVHFHEEVAHFSEEIVQMIRPHHIRQPRLLQYAHGIDSPPFPDQKKRAHTAAFFGWHTRKLAQRQVTRRMSQQRNVCDYQRPFTPFSIRQAAVCFQELPHSPAFGVST